MVDGDVVVFTILHAANDLKPESADWSLLGGHVIESERVESVSGLISGNDERLPAKYHGSASADGRSTARNGSKNDIAQR